jgi:hypothetical protein
MVKIKTLLVLGLLSFNAISVEIPKFQYGDKVRIKKSVTSSEIEFYNLHKKIATIRTYTEGVCMAYSITYKEYYIPNATICEKDLELINGKK